MWDPNEESDSEEEFDGPDVFKGRDALIFLIDANLHTVQERFQNALFLIRDSLLSGLLTREKDLAGIVFCNTKNSPDPKDMRGMENVVVSKNTAVLLPLKPLSKDSVDYYLNFSTPNYFDFENRWGIENGSFANALRLCTNMFKQCGYKLSTSTITYITDRDIPHPTDQTEFQKALQKAKDLEETDVDFNILPMFDEFNYEKFFKEFLCIIRDIDLDQFVVPDIEHERKLIANRNLRPNTRKNCNAHLKWTLGDGLNLSVALYNYFRKSVYAKSVKMLREDNTIVDVKRVHKVGIPDPETNEITEEKYLKPGDERKVLTVGGRRVAFTNDEISKMRSPLSPGIRLLGFMKKLSISLHNYTRTSSFVYPDDNIINGSSKLFRTIWEKCLEKDKLAICVMVLRRKSQPRYIALEPVKSNPEISDSILKKNDGFRVIYLPFEDDYRNLNLSNFIVPNVPEAGVDLFNKIIKKLKIKYTPDMIKDPFLEILHINIIGSAFDIEMEGTCDGGMPDVQMQDERIEQYIDELTEIFGQNLEVAKRRRDEENGETSTRPSKAPKIAEECPSRETIQLLINNNTLTSLTVKQLKSYLQSQHITGLSTTTKPVLIQKIIELHT